MEYILFSPVIIMVIMCIMRVVNAYKPVPTRNKQYVSINARHRSDILSCIAQLQR